MKRNGKKKLIMIILACIFPFLGVIVLATGLFSVVSFAKGVIDDAAAKISEIRETVEGKLIEDQIDLADLSSYDIDTLITVVDDPDIFTEDLLDQMMIERESLKQILVSVKEYNESYEEADKKIQVKHTYTKTKKKGKKEEKTQVEEYVDWDYHVTTQNYEGNFHKVNWQSVYVTAIEQTLQNYGTNFQLMQQDTATEGQLSADSNEEAGSLGEDAEETASDGIFDAEAITNTDLGPFKAGWKAQSTYQATQELKYRQYIEDYAAMYNLPPDLIRAVITAESGWDPTASSGIAYGLCQCTKQTWTAYAVNVLGYTEEDIWEPQATIHTCARILSDHFKTFDGDVILAISAYNQGAGNVKKWISSNTVATGTHLTYAAKVLTFFTGKTYTCADLNAGNYVGGASIDVSVGFGSLNATGRISLTKEQVQEIVYQFEPKFSYSFDVVRDTANSYTYEQCQELPNYGEKTSGDPDTEDGAYSWYEPVSSLDKVEAPFFDAIYTVLNKLDHYVLRIDRWETLERYYWNGYDGEWFRNLVKLLPNGKEVPKYYDYIASIASDIVEYDGKNAYYPGAGGSGAGIGAASGNYTPLSGVTPSITIPEDCGGMGIPLYLQWDSRWKTISFGGGNISTSGCGPTAVSMVVSYLNQKCIYPDDVVAVIGNKYYVAGVGQSWEMVPEACKAFGCRAQQQTVNADAIVASLKAGHPVIVSTSGYGTTQEFTQHGHYIVLRGITDDGMILVNDPNDSSKKKHYTKAYTPQFIYSECCENGNPKVMYTIYGPGE